jgi:hypothetical protein
MTEQKPAGYCYIHDVVEPDQEDGIRCFECKHEYKSEEELVREFNKAMRSFIADRDDAVTLKDVPFCPLCLHDL